jgi:hypothetical protein
MPPIWLWKLAEACRLVAKQDHKKTTSNSRHIFIFERSKDGHIREAFVPLAEENLSAKQEIQEEGETSC